MAVVGVETESIGACGGRFAGFPESPPSTPGSGVEAVRAAVARVSAAWGAADGLIVGDQEDFVARVQRAVALYGEADAALASRGREGTR